MQRDCPCVVQRHLALELVRACKGSGMRATIASRDAKSRGVELAENDVSAPFTMSIVVLSPGSVRSRTPSCYEVRSNTRR